jgi:hydroxymethylpyrimidine/phosphomethylpyrimidine kinase
MKHQTPVALTIAGSDSGGGAGIQADLKTFQAFGVFGTTVITAVTAQNTTGVRAIHQVPAQHVRLQIDAVCEDLRPAALKSGMLASSAQVEAASEGIRAHHLGPYVLDPVMVASSGDRLLDRNAELDVIRKLFPLAALVTPNLDEAEALLGRAVTNVEEMRDAARALVDLGAAAALVKGGHLAGAEVVDVLWDGREERSWRRPRIETRNTHGTGCTLSAAVAAALAWGLALQEAVDVSVEFLTRAIETAPGLGAGHGPVNHLLPVSIPGRRRPAR